MKMCVASIMAAIICYNPELDRLWDNIEALRKQVTKILIIDNASKNNKKISELINKLYDVELINNSENLGIAAALNQALDYSKDNNYKWLLTLDQDSIIMEGLIDAYIPYLQIPDLSMVSCILMDRNVQEYTQFSKEKYDDVDRCITSACLHHIDRCLSIGGYDEKMFIDYVDYEMCLRLKQNNFKLIRVNFYGLLHEVGNNTKRLKVLGRNLCIKGNPIEIHNETPMRDYYFFRNLIYIMRKHRKNARGCTSCFHILWRMILILIFEHNRLDKFKKICIGIYDGFRMDGCR